MLKTHLDDFIEMRELAPALIRIRIQRIDSKLCTAELRAILPDPVFAMLAKDNFKRLRDSLESVFANWI